jgi:hypothetical protein
MAPARVFTVDAASRLIVGAAKSNCTSTHTRTDSGNVFFIHENHGHVRRADTGMVACRLASPRFLVIGILVLNPVLKVLP